MSDGSARAIEAAEALGLAVTVTRHGPVRSLAEAAAARGVEARQIVKTMVVRISDDDHRFVLVPGLTDEPSNVDGVARFAAGLGNIERVDVLPFHRLGAAKYTRLGLPFHLADTPPPDRTLIDRVVEQFAATGLHAS